MKDFNVEAVSKYVDLINQKLPFKDLKGNKSEREVLTTEKLGRNLLIFLKENCECVQKIYYGKGRNAYRYYAPKGFLTVIEKAILAKRIKDIMIDIQK